MFWKNFITLLRRYTASSLLNIIGMSVAFASVYLLMVQVTNDLSYNKKIPDADLIYRLEHPNPSTEGNWYAVWNNDFPFRLCDAIPEVESRGATWLLSQDAEFSYKVNDEIRNINLNLSRSDEEAFKVFGFELIAGTVEDMGPRDIVLKESVANRYGLEVGELLYFGRGTKEGMEFNVVGIYSDFPKPSDIATADCFILLPEIGKTEKMWSYNLYVRLYPNANAEDVTAKMRENLLDMCRKEGLSEEETNEMLSVFEPRLNPLTRLYFATECEGDMNKKGNATTTYTLLAIAILILAIAFINFVNFFFALIPVRIRTVNNLKIFGAPTIRLRFNFLFETLGLITLSILGAAIIVVAFADSPLINYISTSVRVVDNWRLILSLIAVLFVLGLLVSIYPAWYITRFSPAMVMKGSFHATKSGRVLRYMLVGIQYVISLTLIIVAIFLHRQHHFMTNHDMGFDKEQLFSINTNVKTLESYYTIADMLKQNPIVEDVTYSDHFFVSTLHGGWNINMNDKQTKVGAVSVAHNFLDFMGIKLVEGRNFSSSDSIAVIMNETGRNQLELKLDDVHTYSGFMQKIVGFSEDYESSPLQYGKEPLCFMVNKDETIINCVYIRISQGVSMKEARDYILNTFMNLDSTVGKNELDEQLHYVDHFLEYYYQSERKLSILITIFTCISILISLMGVFGLVLFETQYRRREIAIRRVNGATVKDILKMFNVQFLKVVAVCSVIAIPLSYYIVDKYLMSFANRIALSAWVFVLSVVIILLLTIFVVTTRSWKAANENPIDAIN
mgnify:CR=1 FL=1